MKTQIVWFFIFLFNIKTFATNSADQNPQTQFRQWFQEQVDKTLVEKDEKKRWARLERLIPDIRKYELDHDSTLNIAARDDISSLLVLYLPYLPSESDFKKSKCETYRTVFFSNAGIENRNELPAMGRPALAILESFCPPK